MVTNSSILAWRIPDRGAWQATVHGTTESGMTEQLSTHSHKAVCGINLSPAEVTDVCIPFVVLVGPGYRRR